MPPPKRGIDMGSLPQALCGAHVWFLAETLGDGGCQLGEGRYGSIINRLCDLCLSKNAESLALVQMSEWKHLPLRTW